MKNLLNNLNDLDRRSFLQNIAKGLFAVNIVPGMASAEEQILKAGGGNAKSAIIIRVLGGMSHVDSFDIKEANKDAMKAAEPIKSSADGIRVGKFFPKMAGHMDKFAQINSMFNTQGAHNPAQYLMSTGYEPRGTVMHPDLGGWINRLATRTSGDIPSYVKIGENKGQGCGFFGSKYAALPVASATQGLQNIKRPRRVTKQHFDERLSLMDQVNHIYEKKVQTASTKAFNLIYQDAVKLMQSKDLDVFDISKEGKATKELYGESGFGQGCLLARRLVEQGVRCIEVTHGGWDFHYGIYEDIVEIAPALDQGVAALMADLSAKGLLDSTLVAVVTEFGRSPELNNRAGRNHHPVAYTCMLAGGGVKGGQKYGKTDAMGKKVIENKVKVPDFNATIAYAMGLPLDHVEMSPEGRPFKIADKGKPITSIF
ncbi:MAG: DUF1501 domain-containing protein [Lentisphaerales bacterium]|nr:DUF1501 domain-containing protein [Lentisphaerales bacterium]